MNAATISARVSPWIKTLLVKQAASKSHSRLVSQDVTEKVLERAFPGIGFRDSAACREAYLLGHLVAVWEVAGVFRETKSLRKSADYYDWPVALVKRALAYARAFPKEIERCRLAETT